ncbi:MAG: hypothetical protein DBY37_07215 [Desulfovibrionaceae bacterium]|nr:MAG: hypothetical protein DBY37_07215 [Desulfovibrionaceae bacterium]
MTDILTELDRWWPVLGILATVFYGWGIYHLSRRFATREEFRTVKAEQEEISGRLDELERRMETVPDSETMHKIQLSLMELRGDMKAVCGRMDGMETSIVGLKNEIAMLIDHHLEGSR